MSMSLQGRSTQLLSSLPMLKGSVVTDVDGNSFLDFSSGIGVTNLGHRDPAVMQAVAEQAEKVRSYEHQCSCL